jgi:hypothetical protein
MLLASLTSKARGRELGETEYGDHYAKTVRTANGVRDRGDLR